MLNKKEKILDYIICRLRSVSFAMEGLKYVFLTQPNFRIHILSASVCFTAGILFDIAFLEWMVLTLSIGVILIAECFNTALECLTDFTSPDIHPLAKITKDVSAGAVLLSSVLLIIILGVIFIPKIIL